MAGFAAWLRENSSGLASTDVATAVCATPPSLENGLLVQVPENDLVCGDTAAELVADEPAPPAELFPAALAPGSSLGLTSAAHRPGPVPVSGAKVTLRRFFYDGFRIALDWAVDPGAIPYSCDALFVYEEIGVHEVLVESNPVLCNSTQSSDPSTLNIALPSLDLQLGHKYRYCLVLFAGGSNISDELELVLGCSDVVTLMTSENSRKVPRLERLDANITAERTLTVLSYVESPGNDCSLSIAVYASGSAVAQQNLNCSSQFANFPNLPPGPYQVCGALSLGGGLPSPRGGRCVTVRDSSSSSASSMDSRLLSAALAAASVVTSMGLLAVLALLTKRVLLNRRAKTMPTVLSNNITNGPSQVFLHGMVPRNVEPGRSPPRYVKLQATTKV